jgi:hypothetical protein
VFYHKRGLSKRAKNKKQQQEPSKPINYSQKVTFDFLKAHLWAAADILRGSLDSADYRQPIMACSQRVLFRGNGEEVTSAL